MSVMDDVWGAIGRSGIVDAVASAGVVADLSGDYDVVDAAEQIVDSDAMATGFVPFEFTGCSPEERAFLNAYINNCGDLFAACKQVGMNPIEIQVKTSDPSSKFCDWYYRAEETIAEMSRTAARIEAVKGTKTVVITKGTVKVTHQRDTALLTRMLVAEHPQYGDVPSGSKAKALVGTAAPVLKLAEG